MNNKISVIVPIYNVAKYLPRCVDSILKQTYENLEIILINDGSTDQSGMICDVYGKKDNRVKVFHQENKGLSGARNAGVFFATGDYISFVDSDDFIADNMLETLYNVAISEKCDIVQCNALRFYDEKEVSNLPSDSISIKVFNTAEAVEAIISNLQFNKTVWNKLYKSEIVYKMPFEEGKTNEDEFWTFYIFAQASKIACINQTLYFYFQRKSSIMGKKYSIIRLDTIEAKLNQQAFIEKNFLELSSISKIDLWTCCLYALQMSKKHLRNDELEQAKLIVKNAMKKYPLKKEDTKKLGLKNRFWFRLFNKAPKLAVNLRNMLSIGVK